MLHTVVMAGGSGTRFWPVSRKNLPKQFLRLFGKRSMIQQAVDRCVDLAPASRTWVVTGAAHTAETATQLPELDASHILVEPCARNTAPCIGVAAIRLLLEDPDATMLVTPADHVISPTIAFVDAVQRAVSTINSNPEKLCLFGVVPDRPATGYGYIERGQPLAGANRVFDVARFREKPSLETAKEFLESKTFLWNSGIFVWRADTIVKAFAEHQPELREVLGRICSNSGGASFAETMRREFPAMPSISIDYAVLEKSRNVCVLEAPFQWDDVGSWGALARLQAPDQNGNTVQGRFCGINTSGCTIYSSGDHVIATIGLSDCVVVHTPQATLVAKLDDESQLRELIKALEQQGMQDVL